jgi:predicted dehydrogenase
MQPKTIAIIGAGMRGTGFAETIHQFSYLGKVVAVAEPRESYRQHLTATYQIPASHVFEHWEEFCAQPKMCDAVVIATMDKDHVGPAVTCLDKGYDVLLEKPMATSLADCRAIEAAQRRSGAIVGVCHSLRYQKGFRKVKELVTAGTIGRVVTLDQLEPVGFWHQAHSFVRGNWSNEGRSTFMLLAKSCHDIDYISYLVGKPCQQVSSFGNLTFFRRANAPAGSTERCTDPCPVEPTCAYSALKQYVNTPHRGAWPANVVSFDHSYEEHLAAIRTGPYGRCVWKCDNDVVDHQVVSMLFADDITATFTMSAFNVGGGRKLRVGGTEGELSFEETHIQIKTFADRNTQQIQIGPEPGGHGGGDTRVVRDWLLALHSREDSQVVANAQESLRSHTIVFAAEKSRHEGRTINIAEM